MHTAVIIDDEPRARRTISELIRLYTEGIEVVGEADGVATGIKAILTHKPDIVLLDIQLSDGSGFELLELLPTKDFQLIFVTAYNQHAIEAFKFAALDYILKPVDPDGFVAALERAKQEVDSDKLKQQLSFYSETQSQPNTENRKIVLKTAETIHILKVSEILKCESDRNYTKFFLLNGESILVSRLLKEYDELLSQYGFFRTHKSHLINLAYMKSFEKRDGGYIKMQDGSMAPVASRKKDQLMRLLDNM